MDQNTHSLAVLLDWYRAMGVDAAVSEEAIDWCARGDTPPGFGFALANAAPAQPTGGAPAPMQAAPPTSTTHRPPAGPREPARPTNPLPTARPSTPAPADVRAFKPAAPDAAELAAGQAARSARSLAELETALRAFDACGLKATAKNLCFYRGTEQARLMIIGEAPGRDEDLEGRPFVGPAGQLLDKMLAAIQLKEADVHITNIVYWRPPGNRTPTPQEAQVCRPFLERQIELVAPDVLLLLGGPAAKHILDAADGIMKIRGRWRDVEIGGRKRKAMPTLHPAYLLRTPAAKRQAWRDLLMVKQALDTNH